MPTKLIKKQKKPINGIAKKLIGQELEKSEDIALSKIAKFRDIEGVKTVSHDSAWK